MNKKFIYGAIIFCASGFYAVGQTPTPQPSPQAQTVVISDGVKDLPKGTSFSSVLKTPPTVETILTEAEKQTANYRETFRDLLATETKTFEKFDKEGSPKDQTVVESDFLVYQSPMDTATTLELRNVVKVGGKPVPDSQSRSQRFLAELQKTSSPESELEKIQKEGARYDKTLETYGLTLFEGRILSEKLRPYFDFKLVGEENLQGEDVYVVSYQQTRKSPFITLNGGSDDSREFGLDFKLDVPGALKKSDAFVRGKLWIDKQTYQIRRELRELTVQGDEPLVLLAMDFIYQPSDYGILVPKQISLQSNVLKKDKETSRYNAVKDTNLNFDYSKFRKTSTDVKVLDDNN